MTAPVKRIALAVFAAGSMSAGVATLAHAGSPQTTSGDIPRLAVSYSDLDLSSEKDVMTLYKRISRAAEEVCPEPSRHSMRITEISRKCVAAAISRAVHEVNSPQLARLEAVRNKHSTEG